MKVRCDGPAGLPQGNVAFLSLVILTRSLFRGKNTLNEQSTGSLVVRFSAIACCSYSKLPSCHCDVVYKYTSNFDQVCHLPRKMNEWGNSKSPCELLRGWPTSVQQKELVIICSCSRISSDVLLFLWNSGCVEWFCNSRKISNTCRFVIKCGRWSMLTRGWDN